MPRKRILSDGADLRAAIYLPTEHKTFKELYNFGLSYCSYYIRVGASSGSSSVLTKQATLSAG